MGNILTVASIIFGDGTYIQFNLMSNILKLQFYPLQKKYVFPAINKIYKIYRNRLLDESKARETVEVSGDGRCDTPGYNAKYCTYSIMSQSNSKILYFHVEKYGLFKALDKL